jgi:hypothetical protein
MNTAGDGVAGVSNTKAGNGVRGVNSAGGHGVLGTGKGTKAAVRALNSSTGDGITATSAQGRGGSFRGKLAAIRLIRSKEPTHPTAGTIGDLFVDKPGRLWYCKRGGANARWVQLA